MIDLLLVALFQAAAGDPAAAETATPAPAAEQPATEGSETEEAAPRRRCRMEQITGSRMPIRVCMSPQQEAAAEEDAREMVRRGSGTYPMASASTAPWAAGN
jgi:hypothetical protein